jgi:SAM-dependent methyltransferase
MRPFVDYYKSQGISPVAQDISDLERHFQRRESLFRLLGIPPGLVRGASVIEFGPGSGHNALYTNSLEPGRLVLVDANPVGVAEARRLFAEHFPPSRQPEIVECLWEEFDLDQRFDIVICEGALPGQLDPPALTRRLARFVRPGGLFFLTCVDHASVLPEVCRRLIGDQISLGGSPVERLEVLRPIFTEHFASLRGTSRSIDDWLLDMFTHPWIGRLFTIPDAIECLADDFDIYSGSPHFFADWRWYKQIVGDERAFNRRAVEAYFGNVINVLDYRVLVEPHSPQLGEAILDRSKTVYEGMQSAEAGMAPFEPLYAVIENLADLVGECSPRTARSLREFAEYLGGQRSALGDAVSFFGRGQQNLSFIRR